MKTKKFSKKLTLNKETILNLDELNFIHGGDSRSKNLPNSVCLCIISETQFFCCGISVDAC